MRGFEPTEDFVAAHQARVKAGRGKPVSASKATPESDSARAAGIPKAVRRGRMNRLEGRYERDVLIPYKMGGAIVDYRFEAVKLRLASGAWYTADFTVWTKDGGVQLHEVKGHMREAAQVRLKVAAETYPLFRFFLCKYDRVSGWHITEY